jgi:hypothetical protein
MGHRSLDGPREEFTVVTETEPEQSPFNVVVHGQGITVWVNSGHDGGWCRVAASGRPLAASELLPSVRSGAR